MEKGAKVRRFGWLIAAVVGGSGGIAPAVHADVWMCTDRQGSVTMADRKLKGMRCTLFSKTPVGLTAPAVRDDNVVAANSGSIDGAVSRGSTWQPRTPGSSPPTLRDEPAGQREREAMYLPWIEQAAEQYQLPVAFIRAVIRVESNFKARVESNRGAMGLMQLMPSVVREMGVPDPWEPRGNILGGARLLRRLADRFDGDFIKVLAAYHAGSGAVSNAGGGIPWEATESYVRRVLDHYYRYVDEAAAPTGTGPTDMETDADAPSEQGD